MSLTDTLGRPVRDLRISVTDRCNFRCTYCMPKEIFNREYEFLAREALLSFEEIDRVARSFVRHGVRKLRLTGGEPLVRKGVMQLVRTWSAELGPAGVRVTNVEPGLVTSELADHVTEPAAAEFLHQWRASVGPIDADQLADTIAFAVSRPTGVNVPHLQVQPTTQG